MSNVSPGVFTKIIDLSTYVAGVPSTIALICALTEKGEDNKLKFLGSISDLVSEYGQPNIQLYGKGYSQGSYCAHNYLGQSAALYFMRPLPDDATFSNIVITSEVHEGDSTSTISLAYEEGVNSLAEIKTRLETSNGVKPICILRPIGRGQHYNSIGVDLKAHSNPTLFNVFVLDIYEKQSDGDEVIIESFDVSLDPTANDNSGESIWICYVLQTYSSVLRAEMTLEGDEYTDGYYDVIKIYDKNIGSVSTVLSDATASISDTKQDFTQWETSSPGTAAFVIIAIDGRGNKLHGWLGDASEDKESIDVYDSKDLINKGWIGNTSYFNDDYGVSYYVMKNYSDITIPFDRTNTIPLKEGSEGSLIDATGKLDTTVATQLLSQAYSGAIDEAVKDTENYYFSMVFDCGYPDDVKTAISDMVQTRRDCVAILDNGDNPTYNDAITKRQNSHVFNNYFCALYEEYSKVYDQFTGQDVWFSPVFHMSYILPRNDTVGELWYAAAGFNRAAIDSIKQLRFSPMLTQRDGMYLKQLNPIVKFNEGYVVWGQLTSQAKASALQDLNIVRLVLYCKRALEVYCRGFIFEQNDQITWNSVAGSIVLFLENIKKRRGLDSYSVQVGATDYERKIKTFHVNVTLNPTRTTEQINLNFFIQ